MSLLKAILASQAIPILIILTAALFSLRSAFFYTRQSKELRSKMSRLDRQLSKLRAELDQKKKAVEECAAVVAPLREQQRCLEEYYEELRSSMMEAERKAMKQDQEKKPDREIKRSSRSDLG